MAGIRVDIARETDADARDVVILLVALNRLLPGLFERVRVVMGVIFVAGKLLALFGNKAVFDMRAANVKADKLTHGLSFCDKPGMPLSMAYLRKRNVKEGNPPLFLVNTAHDVIVVK
ncbi:FIG00554585: hypothetical protein [Cronobacter malonaticus 507]|nr:FIG00554585: hypothetical protein [Cronobacter malonaticus 507]